MICITEHIPAHEMLRVYTYVRPKGVTLIGPNCPGVLSPGKANVGIIPAEVFKAGSIGLVSRSGTLTYQIGYEVAQRGLGNSTIVGIGGDPVVGSSFIDILEKFEADPETKYVVLVGEIGGDEEEKAAAYVSARMSKPVFSYIAGFSAPPGKTMGHAGAIISGSSGTAAREEGRARSGRASRSARRRPRSPSSSSPRRGRSGGSAGSASLKRAPAIVLSALAVPPCASAASRTIARPRPAPGFERAVAAR